ncbi:calcium-binding protein [Neotabrizicola shimadae]|uniref:Calcium-binding protein n=1 Tax=Neotabrizicola shimadae TaxID=2807096 RepID=A0A8G0ZY05_9RHOB|nr:calcium-binding protein [Neotabrizicola shimadae]QYZ71077.1 hypothetical protein JO391_06090 [Neotabrizicola shimadae]
MTMHAYNSTILFAGPLVLDLFDGLVIGTDGFVYGQHDLFSGTTDGQHNIFIAGTAATSTWAFLLGDFGHEMIGSTITLTATGVVRGFVGVDYIGAGLELGNAGTISGDLAAIRLEGGSASVGNLLVNSGTIIGGQAIDAFASTLSATTIINSGLIRGTLGTAISLAGTDTDDAVVNSGRIIGHVELGGGEDSYDGRGGEVMGTVRGGDGNDRFRPGAGEDSFDGGSGSDLLDFRTGDGAVELALDGSWDSTGWAEGDTYTGFERVIGTTQADRIGGNSAANILNGGAGADQLFGQAGADTLIGGGGIDILSGGAGNDSFQFNRLAECGDLLADFSSAAAGNNDRFLISADFGGGLAAGSLAAGLFVSRADNLAQDGNDRFIFRTADRTLWFDADGTGTGAGVLVASLQAGATMTAADIVIF